MKFKQFLSFIITFILSFPALMAGLIIGLLVKYWNLSKAAFLEGFEYGVK